MDWKKAWLEIFTEAFEGVKPGADGTYFVNGDEALFPILESLSPEQASKRANENVNSIAAHGRHAAYYVSLINMQNRGEKVDPDWKGSWSVQSVDEGSWDTIRADLRRQYTEFRDWMVKHDGNLDEETGMYVMAQLAHAAFHLGSIRQLAMSSETHS